MTGQRGARPITDHYHPDYWTRAEQHRREDRIDSDIDEIRAELKAIGNRLTLMVGALGLVAFVLPILAPFIRVWLGVDVPSGGN